MSPVVRESRDGKDTGTTCRYEVLTVIVPVFTASLDRIVYMYNNEGTIYKSFEELLEAPYKRYYIVDYDIFWKCFENWKKDKDFQLKFTQKIYTGTPTKYNWIAPEITITSMTGTEAPRVGKIRGGYNGKNFVFNDYGNFIRGVSTFNVNLEVIQEGYEVIKRIEKIGCSIHENYYPSSIASLARQVFGDPIKMNDKSRYDFCRCVRSSYRGGLYYVNKILKRFPIVYDYDIRSMYPFLLTTQLYPNPAVMPQLEEDFVAVDNKTQLALYHINTIRAKRKPQVPFNTMFTVLEEQNRLLHLGCSVSFNGNIRTTKPLPLLEGWITSIDLMILERDYDIQELFIDYTYVYNDLKWGRKLFPNMNTYFVYKEQSTGGIRTAYKILLDSYTGSLGAIWRSNFKMSSLDLEDCQIIPKKASNPAPVDIAAFLCAYGRLYITQLAQLCEPGTIQSIDTDGIFTTAPAPKLEAICGNKLGNIRLDKVMYDAVWFGNKQYESREDNPNADFTPHIAGLPAYLYKHGEKNFEVPRYVYDLRQNQFVYEPNNFTLIDDDEEITEYE